MIRVQGVIYEENNYFDNNIQVTFTVNTNSQQALVEDAVVDSQSEEQMTWDSTFGIILTIIQQKGNDFVKMIGLYEVIIMSAGMLIMTLAALAVYCT
jgi:hypothetical protein